MAIHQLSQHFIVLFVGRRGLPAGHQFGAQQCGQFGLEAGAIEALPFAAVCVIGAVEGNGLRQGGAAIVHRVEKAQVGIQAHHLYGGGDIF